MTSPWGAEVARRWAPRLAVASITGLAAVLRFSGLAWGLRHPAHIDERDFVENVVAMVNAGDLDHRYYFYPGLFYYLLAPGVALLGAARNGPEAYLVSRGLVAAFGVLNVALACFVGFRLVGRTAGLVAGLLLAVSPLDVATCHQVRPDILLQTAGLLALLAWPRVGMDAGGDRLAGLVIGAATAVKYTGLLLVPSYAAARLLAPGRRARGLVVAGATAAVVVLASTPYALVHTARYAQMSVKQVTDHYQDNESRPGFLGHLGEYFGHAGRTLGPVAAGLACVGLWDTARSSWRSWCPPLLHLVTTFLVMASASLGYPRHILPVMGVLCLLAGVPLERLGRRSRLAALALAALAAASPLNSSVRYVRRVSHPSAQDKALDWIQTNLPPGSRILETRPDADFTRRAGAGLGIDPRTYELVTYTTRQDPRGLCLLAPEMDLTITAPGRGRRWASGLRMVFGAINLEGEVVLALRAPEAAVRPAYLAVDLSAARLSASDDQEHLPELHDGDPATSWTSRALLPERWLEIEFDRPVPVGRLELSFGDRPKGYGPELSVLTRGVGANYGTVWTVEARPPLLDQIAAGRAPGKVLLIQPQPVTGLRILQRGPQPLDVSELRVDARLDTAGLTECLSGPAKKALSPP